MLRVGLTGGIACGKTYVRRRMHDAGLATLDLDQVAHEVMAPGGSAYADVVAEFGPGICGPDGRIDRSILAGRVFASPASRTRLNALVHPRVREEEERHADERAAAGAPLLVTDAALLVEAGYHLRFDRLLVAHCPPEEQLRRLRLRDGLDEAAARARLRAQMPIGEKRAFAHLLVDTGGTFGQTDAAVDAATLQLVELAQQPRVRPRIPLARAQSALRLGDGPRGLTATRLLAEIVAARGMEMERLARLLTPPVPAGEPWYRAALRGGSHGPETLAGAVALWSLARTGGDREYTAAAAASLARLTHAEAGAVAGACLAALALQEALTGEATPDVAAASALAQRWGGAPAPDGVRRIAAADAARVREARAVDDGPERSALAALGFE